jgi:hypothetical protein
MTNHYLLSLLHATHPGDRIYTHGRIVHVLSEAIVGEPERRSQGRADNRWRFLSEVPAEGISDRPTFIKQAAGEAYRDVGVRGLSLRSDLLVAISQELGWDVFKAADVYEAVGSVGEGDCCDRLIAVLDELLRKNTCCKKELEHDYGI